MIIESKLFKSCLARESSSLTCSYRLGSGKRKSFLFHRLRKSPLVKGNYFKKLQVSPSLSRKEIGTSLH